MDSMPPQLAAGMSWQIRPADQAPQPYAVPGQALHQGFPCTPGHLLMGSDIGGSYEPVKEETADDAISALLSAPAFQSSLMRAVSDAALPLVLEKPLLTIDTSPGLLASRSDARSSCPPSGTTTCELPADAVLDAARKAHALDDCTGSPDTCADPSSKKRHRLRPEQTRRLMEVFEKTTKPDSDMRKVLGKELGMTPRTVQIWFQNRRAKLKRESLAAGTLKAHGRFPARSPDGRGRLTFNHAYMSRRQPVRVASEGFEHMRQAGGFPSYLSDSLCGLPLQNPSQISVPLDMSLHLPGVQLSSAVGAQALGQSAMGVPAGQPLSVLGDIRPSDHAIHTMFPIGAHGYPALAEHAHMYSSESLGIAHGQAVSSQGGAVPTVPHLYDHRAGHGDRSSRFRSFTTDSHTLAHLGQLAHGLDPSIPTGGPTFAQQDFGAGSEHAALHSGNHHRYAQPLPGSDVPTADALLETRRRHLQDLMIINQTHAARDLHARAAVSSAGARVDHPLLFSDLAQQQQQQQQYPAKDDLLAAQAAAINGSSSGRSQGTSALTGIPVPSSCNPGAASLSASLAALPGRNSTLNPSHSAATTSSGSEAGTDQGSAVGQGAGDAAMSQYQILHNILMQYTGMEFLDGCGDSSQPSKALDQPLFMPETGADGMLPTTLADISAGLGAISGSLFGEEHTPPTSTAAAAAAISFGMGCGFGSDLGGCGLSSSDSLSAGTSDDGSRTSGAPTQTVTPTACGSSPPPKAEVQKVVSVASEAPVGQREVMIEQLAFSTIPF